MENQQQTSNSGQIHPVQLSFSAQGFEDALALCRKGSHPDIARMSRAAFAFYEWFLQELSRNAEVLTIEADGTTRRIAFAPGDVSNPALYEADPSDRVVVLQLTQEGFERMEALHLTGGHLNRSQMARAAYVLYSWYQDEVEKKNELVVREADGSTARITFSDPMASGGEDG